MSEQVTTTEIDLATLVEIADGPEEPTVVYRFANGREFVQEDMRITADD